MDTCFNCKKFDTSYHYMEGQWFCRDCYIHPQSRVALGLQVDIGDGQNKRITAAHIDDIQHRFIGPEGNVYRETHRSSIRR